METFREDSRINFGITVSGDSQFESNVTISDDLRVSSNIIVTGDIIPDTGYSSSIGSIIKPFKNIYVQSSTLYFVNERTSEEVLSSSLPLVNALSVKDGRMELNIIDPDTNEVTSNLKVGSNFVTEEKINLFLIQLHNNRRYLPKILQFIQMVSATQQKT